MLLLALFLPPSCGRWSPASNAILRHSTPSVGIEASCSSSSDSCWVSWRLFQQTDTGEHVPCPFHNDPSTWSQDPSVLQATYQRPFLFDHLERENARMRKLIFWYNNLDRGVCQFLGPSHWLEQWGFVSTARCLHYPRPRPPILLYTGILCRPFCNHTLVWSRGKPEPDIGRRTDRWVFMVDKQ